MEYEATDDHTHFLRARVSRLISWSPYSPGLSQYFHIVMKDTCIADLDTQIRPTFFFSRNTGISILASQLQWAEKGVFGFSLKKYYLHYMFFKAANSLYI
jgi:hypothetical protein